MTGLFGKHGRTFARAIRRQEYLRTETGILFPRLGAVLAGTVIARTRHGEVRGHNLITTQAVPILAVITAWSSPLAACYIGLMGADVTPDETWTADQFSIIGGELADAPEGYDEATRVPFVGAAAGPGLTDNSASPAAFTMRTASSISVYGMGLLVDPGKRQAIIPVDLTGTVDPVDTDGTTSALPGYGVHHVTTAGDPWYDPSGDDFFDSGLGRWVDPSLDSFQVDPAAQALIAVARFPGGPSTFNDMDPLNITWQLQLNT